MKNVVVSNWSLVFAFLLVLVSIGISVKEKLGLTKDILVSVVRAIIQLVIIGYILKVIFNVNTFWLTFVSTLVIIFNASWNANGRDPNTNRKLWNSIAGNEMVAIGLCYKSLNESFHDLRQPVLERLALGSDIKTASMPIIRRSIKTAMQPTIDSAKTVGLVNLPGMMSGLIFAGVNPIYAIKYQIMVTFMLLSATSLGAIISVYLAYKNYFNDQMQLML